jgi:catechol 2,3-dioxygenase-like lactoylglutathione lyase family enzyme
MEGTQFRYVIKFVTDMNKAVKFYRDTLGLQLRFESPAGVNSRRAKLLSPCTRLPTRTRRERSKSDSLSPTWRPSTGT